MISRFVYSASETEDERYFDDKADICDIPLSSDVLSGDDTDDTAAVMDS